MDAKLFNSINLFVKLATTNYTAEYTSFYRDLLNNKFNLKQIRDYEANLLTRKTSLTNEIKNYKDWINFDIDNIKILSNKGYFSEELEQKAKEFIMHINAMKFKQAALTEVDDMIRKIKYYIDETEGLK